MSDLGERRKEFARLLNQALNLADALALPPEIGARLQEVIDLSADCLDSPAQPDEKDPPAFG